MKNVQLKKIKGISLLEVMLSLAIIAIILVMATRFFASALMGSNVNVAAQEFGQIKAKLNSMAAAEGTPIVATATMATLCTAGLDEKICGANNGGNTNPWGGSFSLATGCLSISGIPTQAACGSLATNINGTCTGGTGGNTVKVGLVTGNECGTTP